MMAKLIVNMVLCMVLLANVAWSAGQATIFVYHRFGDSRYPSTNIALDDFANQLEYLKQSNYTVLYASDIVQRLKSGEPLPERCAALTVDDGYLTFLTGAMPLLRQYAYPVTLFVSTASVGGNNYLTWQQLRQLHAEGVEIGNHSHLHPYFVSDEVADPVRWHENARADIMQAQSEIHRHLNFIPTLVAYPYGEYSPALEKLVAELGFEAAFAQQSGVVTDNIPVYCLPRFPMGGVFATLAGFKHKLAMHPLPVTVLTPESPILAENDPPEMIFSLDTTDIIPSTLRCYVQGQEVVVPEPVDDLAGYAGTVDNGVIYRVRAAKPLSPRRNKYTLTAQGRNGNGWYWYSHLWVHPDA
jgi:peptidoglycan/xylan/chitin deacetylase (PgdA/CDA1 family)